METKPLGAEVLSSADVKYLRKRFGYEWYPGKFIGAPPHHPESAAKRRTISKRVIASVNKNLASNSATNGIIQQLNREENSKFVPGIQETALSWIIAPPDKKMYLRFEEAVIAKRVFQHIVSEGGTFSDFYEYNTANVQKYFLSLLGDILAKEEVPDVINTVKRILSTDIHTFSNNSKEKEYFALIVKRDKFRIAIDKSRIKPLKNLL